MGLFTLAAVIPFLGVAGPIAVIIICLYIIIYLVLALAISAVAALGAYWVRKQSGVIKQLRPTVESVNKATEAIQKGIPPAEIGNPIIRTVAKGPARVHTIDQQVSQASDRVVNAAIEFRARTLQIQIVIKSFLKPRELSGITSKAEQASQIPRRPDYRQLAEQLATGLPVPGDKQREHVSASP
jgi:flagellar basal body-associated protein FliL